ncbi:MAG: hypothetical protein IJI14_14380 [Anaerolineaceae bacterium]|nr:hypothetical protein [Anaerolineaceae bacterium]
MKVANCKYLKSVEIGQTIYLEPTGNFARMRNTGEPIEAVVTKIGKKYFYVESKNSYLWIDKFPLDGGDAYSQNSNGGYNVYESEEVFRNKIEMSRKRKEIDVYFRSAIYCGKLSDEAVKKIHNILSDEGVLVLR